MSSRIPISEPAHRRVLIVTPHFPPDTMAAAHRIRLLAPYLRDFGWEPIVLTADPDGYESAIEPALEALVPPDLRILRYRAWPARWTRRLGIGDLGLRSWVPAFRTAAAFMRREAVDALLITTYPVYTAAIGPLLKRRFHVPFVIDLQDPWVGAWGRVVGGGPDGSPDAKSRASRWIAACLERPVLGSADAIIAVSAGTYEQVQARVPAARQKRCAEIPLGGDGRDFDLVRARPRRLDYFDPADGFAHICAVGTLLPRGTDVARALFEGLAALRRQSPALAGRIRLHFFGTSNQRAVDAPPRALPIAEAAGVVDLVTEHPGRIDYLDAIDIQTRASALLLLGSLDAHYTASRLYPALLARRPLVAVYHEASSVTTLLRRHTRGATVQLITFDGDRPVSGRISDITAALDACARGVQYDATDVDPALLAAYSARSLAERLASVLSAVV